MRALILTTVLLACLPVSAMEQALDIIGQGGITDNLALANPGSADREGSAVARLVGLGVVSWGSEKEGNKLYVSGVSDNKIHTADERATIAYLEVVPGYATRIAEGMFPIDVSLHLSANFAGDNSGDESIGQTRYIRSGAPSLSNDSPFTITAYPSTYWAYGVELSGYYDLGRFWLGPLLRYEQRSHIKVNQDDTRLSFGAQTIIPFGKYFSVTTEVASTSLTSSIEQYSADGTWFAIGADLDWGKGYSLGSDLHYETRRFTGTLERDDKITGLHVGLTKSVLKDFSLLFDSYFLNNESTIEPFGYTASIFAIGMKWSAF